MENNHRKSKRSLRGEDVYELACRYDVGWSMKKQKIKAEPVEVKVEGSQASGTNEAQSGTNEAQSGTNETQSEERNKTNSEEHRDSAGPKVEDTEFNVREIINDNNNKSKQQLQEANKDANQEQNDIEQDLNPLHTKWTFTREERAKLKSQGVKLKMGSWSKKEINQLEENMKNYLKENNITDPTPLILAENGKRGKNVKSRCSQTNFYRSLGKGIHRPLFYIYRRVLRMYNPENHIGRYTEAESQEILRYHAIYGDKWAKIGSLIGRSGNSVHHHYLDMQKARSGSWSEKEIERLNAAVRATTGTDFGVQICRGICWTEVASLVITRTADQCRGKWMTDTCWRTTNGEKNVKWDSEDDVKLIQRLYSAVEADENDIDWVSITKDLPNAPSVTWLRTQWLTLKKVVPDYTECDYEEILDYLYNTHRPSVMKRKTEDTQNS